MCGGQETVQRGLWRNSTEKPLPCSPSLESESNIEKRQKAREEEEEEGGEKMCGRGEDKEDKLEWRRETEVCVCQQQGAAEAHT